MPTKPPSADQVTEKIYELISEQRIMPDRAQSELIEALGQVGGRGKRQNLSGIYIYGPPGRGKTMIINAFVASLNPATTARYHFHEFFQKLNSPIHRTPGQRLGSIFRQGLERELQSVQVLVFDEFHCTEPGDAMLMVRLFKYCSEHAISLVTTSNYEPDKLLDDDAFHHLVAPTIESIKEQLKVFCLDYSIDYRTVEPDTHDRSSGYRAGTLNVHLLDSPLQQTPAELVEIGYDTIGPAFIRGDSIQISFQQVCGTRRNTSDYLQLSERYRRWYITDVPASQDLAMDEARRVANLIDIFYDRDIEVHFYTQDRLENLGHMLHPTETERLASRLAQLQLNVNSKNEVFS